MRFFEILDGIGTFLAVSSGLPISLFVFFYAKRSDWRSTDAGKALMYQSIAMLSIILVVILSLIFGEYPGRAIIRVVGYGFLFGALCGTLGVLLRYQNSAHAEEYRAQLAKDLIEETRWAKERKKWVEGHTDIPKPERDLPNNLPD